LTLAALLAGVLTASAGMTTVPDVSVRPLASFRIGAPSETRFGRLQWLGGLQISDQGGIIGGLSECLTYEAGGKLLALSDDGVWMSARIIQDDSGRPLDLADVKTGELSIAGSTRRDKSQYDSEGLGWRRTDRGIEAFVSFEGRHRIAALPVVPSLDDLPMATGREMPETVPLLATLRFSKGLEALAATPVGHPLGSALIGISEWPKRGETDLTGFIIGGTKPGTFKVRRRDDFDATSAAFLPSGDLVLLERRFSLLTGPAMRIRLIKGGDLAPGKLVDGADLIVANISQAIDNMEAIGVDRAPDGATILTLMSDDNHSVMQRTLLLRFKLLDSAP
jgi:hypothetical protein